MISKVKESIAIPLLVTFIDDLSNGVVPEEIWLQKPVPNVDANGWNEEDTHIEPGKYLRVDCAD